MTTINNAPATTEEFNFVRRQVRKIAWRRSYLIALGIGILGSVAASDEIKNTAQAFGYTVGYGGAAFVMGTGAAMVCGKSRDF